MNSADPSLPGALSSLSALIFLTLLWQCFTLLESSDLNTYYSFFYDGVVRQDKGVLFGLTFVETVCGLLALIAWFGKFLSFLLVYLKARNYTDVR